MPALGPQALGTSRTYELTLSGPGEGSSLEGVFSGAETFAARIWTGDDQASLATPTASWDPSVVDNPAGVANPVLLLSVPASAIADLAPAPYRVRVVINPGTDDVLAYEGLIELTAAPGSAEPAPVYCGFDELRKFAPWIGELITRDTSLQSDLAEQRARARTRLEDAIVAAYRPWGRRGRRRGNAFLLATTTGTFESGPSTWLREQLADDRLMVAGPRGDRAREITARLAIAFACEGQLGATSDQTPFQALGVQNARKAESLIAGYTAELDLNDDGVPDLWVRCGVLSHR